jgi:uncharacterized protein YecT (DUF1311 family)
MPQVDLTALSPTELRRLLNATRERGQASQSYQILQEMAARRDRGRLLGGRRPAEPRVIAVDLDDPLEQRASVERTADEIEDDIPPLPPGWVPQAPSSEALAAAGSAAQSVAPPRAPRRQRKAQPAAEPPKAPRPPPKPLAFAEATRLSPRPLPEPEPLPHPDNFTPAFSPTVSTERPPRIARWSGAIFAAGVGLGVASGWWAGGVTRDLMQRDAAQHFAAVAPAPHVAPVASRLEAAAAAPAATQLAEASEPATQRVSEPQAPPPVSPQPVSAADEASADASAEVAQPEVAPARPCAAAPTPADRTICAHPRLQTLQRSLRRAYAEALQVHQDRALLRQHQLAWRETRNDVAAPDRLARLYDDRIRRLHAATADARRRARRA